MDQTVLTRSYGKPRQKTIKYVDYVVVNLLAQVGKRLKLGSAFKDRCCTNVSEPERPSFTVQSWISHHRNNLSPFFKYNFLRSFTIGPLSHQKLNPLSSHPHSPFRDVEDEPKLVVT